MQIGQNIYPVVFEEHEHAQGSAARDNNMRAAVFMSLLTPPFRCLSSSACCSPAPRMALDGPGRGYHRGLRHRQLVLWPDPRHRAILLDMNPDRSMAGKLRQAVEGEGDQLADLHLWRFGPGHLGAIVSVVTAKSREPDYFGAGSPASPRYHISQSRLRINLDD